jgi:ABC-type nickel/cobalt efflux system permease component RcnA
MRFLRGVAAILLLLAGTFVAVALLWVVGLTFLFDGSDWRLATENGFLAAGAIVLMSALAWIVWPSTNRHAHRRPSSAPARS